MNVTTALLEQHRRAEALRRLSERCRLLLSGLDNDEGDPRLLFTHLPYSDVAAAAACNPHVALALARVPLEWWRRE